LIRLRVDLWAARISKVEYGPSSRSLRAATPGSLNAARSAGNIRVWYLGVGLDPLTLAGEILTVLVIDADVFDQIFANVVAWNSEGDVVFSADGSVGVPWRRDTVYWLLAAEPLAPAARACLELAWKYQDVLLGSRG
jgi:hypothetical protein